MMIMRWRCIKVVLVYKTWWWIVQNQALNVGSELLKPVLPITILYSSFIALKIYHEYHYAQMNIKSIHYQNKLTKLYIYVGI